MPGTSNLERKTEIFSCPLCGKIFDSRQTLDAHKDKEHGTTPEPPAGVG